MGTPVILPVPFKHQMPGLCGAACAQMVLKARNVPGVDTSDTVQADLWSEIKSHSDGPLHQREPKCSLCGFFDNQVCEHYLDCYQCWCTHPRALVKTLNTRLGGGGFTDLEGTQEEVTAIAVDRIDRGLASVMLVYGTQHWVVVRGYTPVAQGGLVLAGRRISHIHVRNPEWNHANNTRDAVPLDGWFGDYMATADFGHYKDHCVIVADGNAQ